MKVKCIKCLKEESCFTPGKVYKVKHGEITSDNGFTYRDSTNAKVLDYLSEWYLFEKINKTVKMREKLRDYCQGRSCSGCKLSGDTCRCGRSTTFMMKDGAGNYTMSNKEIKAAFNIVFGTGIKDVKRNAKVGEYVKIVNAMGACGKYKDGDILKIVDSTDLVEESPKLYNGKIIFTKGDDTFKTGHIYEIKDGKIMLGDRKYPSRFNGGVLRSIEDVRKYFDKDTTYGWGEDTLEFIEVIDD